MWTIVHLTFDRQTQGFIQSVSGIGFKTKTGKTLFANHTCNIARPESTFGVAVQGLAEETPETKDIIVTCSEVSQINLSQTEPTMVALMNVERIHPCSALAAQHVFSRHIVERYEDPEDDSICDTDYEAQLNAFEDIGTDKFDVCVAINIPTTGIESVVFHGASENPIHIYQDQTSTIEELVDNWLATGNAKTDFSKDHLLGTITGSKEIYETNQYKDFFEIMF